MVDHFSDKGADHRDPVFPHVPDRSDADSISGQIRQLTEECDQIYSRIGRSFYEDCRDHAPDKYRNAFHIIREDQMQMASLQERQRQAAGSWRCPVCGTENASYAVYCMHCGAKRASAADVQKTYEQQTYEQQTAAPDTNRELKYRDHLLNENAQPLHSSEDGRKASEENRSAGRTRKTRWLFPILCIVCGVLSAGIVWQVLDIVRIDQATQQYDLEESDASYGSSVDSSSYVTSS